MRTRIWPIGLVLLVAAATIWMVSGSTPATAQQQAQIRPLDVELELLDMIVVSEDATQPLVWVVPYVADRSYYTETPLCSTGILVRNLGRIEATVEVDWISDISDEHAFRRHVIGPAAAAFFVTKDEVDAFPFRRNENANLARVDAGLFNFEYQGSATVYASHPYVTTSAFMYCRDANAADTVPSSVTNLPTFAVGQARALFGDS